MAFEVFAAMIVCNQRSTLARAPSTLLIIAFLLHPLTLFEVIGC